ncbi:MAG TPA: hypothetical protein VFG20_04110, partial [Planctomycetaceae bacterium]|nr:hypothetical protein [Planctomycetaceae bacterium]
MDDLTTRVERQSSTTPANGLRGPHWSEERLATADDDITVDCAPAQLAVTTDVYAAGLNSALQRWTKAEPQT